MEENVLHPPIKSTPKSSQPTLTSVPEKSVFGSIGNVISSELKSGSEKIGSYKEPYDSKTNKVNSSKGASNDSFEPSNIRVGESGLCSNMKQLSIDDKKVTKHNVRVKSPVSVDDRSSGNRNIEENEGSKDEVQVNQNFEHFKEGINCILKNHEEDVYLQYISKLMTVADEEGNT